jgi:hypothetical protein
MFRCKSELRMFLFACALVFPTSASAQFPIGGIIQTGTLTVTSTSSRPVLTVLAAIAGAGDVNAFFDDGAFEVEQCRPCVAGSVIGIGARITSGGAGNQFYEADLTVTGTPLQIPDTGFAELTLSSPFTLQGRLIVSPRRESAPHEKDPVVELEGAGTVTVKLTSSVDPETGQRIYFFQDASYQFSPPAK